VASRDPFLDNCKFALILLIGIGHSLQWLLAQEDSRTARGWCAVEGEVGDVGHSDAPRASSWAVLPLRAFYIWSNAIAIPMFALLSGRVSRSLAASCAPEASAERRATMPARIKKTVESLVVPFLTFQLLACLVEASSPALASALAPRPPPSATFAANDGNAVETQALQFDGCEQVLSNVMNPPNAFSFWTPHLSWYLLALASWRAVLPAAAQMQPGAALALALALGVGVGICNVGYSAGFFLKFGTMWGNFPYFLAGVFLCGDETYFAFRDDWATAGRRAGAAAVTAAAVAACFFGLRSGAMCFDAWQWEAWKSAPYGDYLFVDAQTPSGTSEWHLWESIAAPLFRLGTYFGSVAVGTAFLAAVPRAEIPAATKMGARTMYGYLLHAPALLAALASAGTFAKASAGDGLSAAAFIAAGVVLPILVTVACMTAPAVWAFRWLCEPEIGAWLWREATEPGTPGSVTSQGSGK
jgi:fucose 4-O-acetylase-like acetyltransferase